MAEIVGMYGLQTKSKEYSQVPPCLTSFAYNNVKPYFYTTNEKGFQNISEIL
jgi:hypothetical protein